MRRFVFTAVATALFTLLSGDFSVRAAGSPKDAMPPGGPDVLADAVSGEASKDGGREAATSSAAATPTQKYEFHPDVQSLDDAIDADGFPAEEGGAKIVVRTPESCREFSSYMDERRKRLDELEGQIRRKREILENLKLEFEDLAKKYAVVEGRVKTLVQRDPNDLKNNPELAKMIRLYESLPPEESAVRLRNLDLDLTIALLKGMKPKKLSLIMEALEPRLAAALSSQIVRGF